MKGYSKVLLLTLIGSVERFSFYAIISVLFLFMTSNEIGLSTDTSKKLYHYFLNCLYFTPILFGVIADLVNRKIVIGFGLIVASLGYFMIYWLSDSVTGFYVGLGIAAVGISAYKPNFWVLLGDTAISYKSSRLALQGYILFGLIGSIVGFVSGFFSAYMRLNHGYQILFMLTGLVLHIPLKADTHSGAKRTLFSKIKSV